MIPFNNPRWFCLAGALVAIALMSLVAPVTHRPGVAGIAWAAQPAQRSEPATPERTDGAEPWTASQTEQAADLAEQLSNPKGKKPLVACVGFKPLYESGHIPGASFHGPASTAQGLDDLKKWAQNLSRSQSIVIYCGCCPMRRCPNVRPAFKALQEMGFRQTKVLVIETDFATDWVQKGYPVQKGK